MPARHGERLELDTYCSALPGVPRRAGELHKFAITTDSGLTEDLLDLQWWIENESDPVLRPVRVPIASPDAMGIEEYLQLALTSGGVTALVGCVRAWIKFRRPKVSVEVKTSDGTKVTLSAENVNDDNEIIKAVARLVEHE
jgi:hypothetical protein